MFFHVTFVQYCPVIFVTYVNWHDICVYGNLKVCYDRSVYITLIDSIYGRNANRCSNKEENAMPNENINDESSSALLAEIADLYYNQGMTQQEIARQYGCNRFKVAKLLQAARDEGIVEINIHRPNRRHAALEQMLTEKFHLSKAIVLDTKDMSRTEAQNEIGRISAAYLDQLLMPNMIMGVTWGKSIRSTVAAMEQKTQNPITAVQLCGCFRHLNSSDGSRNIARTIAQKTNGQCFFMNIPVYINDPAARIAMIKEPIIEDTLSYTHKMDLVLTGIGSLSSLPFNNTVLKDYISDADRAKQSDCIGSIYGYVLNQKGEIADLELNRKLIAASLPDIMATPHRLAVATGRHKVQAIVLCMQNRFINELVTDRATAEHIMEYLGNAD